MVTVPKAGVYGFNWFNVWYMLGRVGVSRRVFVNDPNHVSFELSNCGNLVAVVSDSTRVLGDGHCSPSGGLGVMEEAFLTGYPGGADGAALRANRHNAAGRHDADKIIESAQDARTELRRGEPRTSRTASRSSTRSVRRATSPCGTTTPRARQVSLPPA